MRVCNSKRYIFYLNMSTTVRTNTFCDTALVNNNATSCDTSLSAFIFSLDFFFFAQFCLCFVSSVQTANANFHWISQNNMISSSLSLFLYLYSSVIICSRAIFQLFSSNSYMNAHNLHRIGIQNENYNEKN